jgi:phospholipid/cholesterol/gamma-HCH transport system substrate-binding protein
MRRSPALRMLALVVLLLVSSYYIAFDVAGWRIGRQDFHVTVLMPRGGGIYTEADVTYRGVTVGRVVRIRLEPKGVQVVAEIYPNERIPARSEASVREMSAAGEQYLDIVPKAGPVTASATRGDGPEYLHAGSVIPAADTSVPVPVNQVLADTSRLLNSINANQLTTVIGTLGTGFNGTAGDLRNIIVAGQALLDALEAASSATIEVITGGHTALKGAVATDSAFGRFASGLDRLSAQLKASNGDFEALLTNASAASRQTDRFLTRSGGSLRSLLYHAGTVSGVSLSEEPELRALFQVLPVFAGRIGTVVRNGTLHVELDYNTDDPVCPYISGSQTALPTQRTGAPSLDRTCTLSTPGALARGAG